MRSVRQVSGVQHRICVDAAMIYLRTPKITISEAPLCWPQQQKRYHHQLHSRGTYCTVGLVHACRKTLSVATDNANVLIMPDM